MIRLHTIHTGYFKLDGGAMFGVVPKSIWNKLNPADENNLCTWAMRCLLVEESDRLILIDTGIGDKQDARFFSHYHLSETKSIPDALGEKGFSVDDVTDVLLTHLHFDHVGGAVIRNHGELEPVCPKATYWTSEMHWHWATHPNPREKASFLTENILPLQESGRLRFVDPDRHFSPGIRLRFVSGHTESMILPQIRYGNRTIVYMADLLPSIAHLPIPYVMAYDMFPLKSLQEKTDFLREALQENFVLYFEHDPVHECCTLQQTEKGIRALKTFELATINGGN